MLFCPFYERGCQEKNFPFDWKVGVFGPGIQPLVGLAPTLIGAGFDLALSGTRAEQRAALEGLGIHRRLVTTSEGSCVGFFRPPFEKPTVTKAVTVATTIKAGIGRHEKFRVMARDAFRNEYLSNSISFKRMK